MEKPSYKYEVIHNTLRDLPDILSISILCELAGVSRSGYYNCICVREGAEKPTDPRKDKPEKRR